MGAGAFVMVELLATSYDTIIAAAILPYPVLRRCLVRR